MVHRHGIKILLHVFFTFFFACSTGPLASKRVAGLCQNGRRQTWRALLLEKKKKEDHIIGEQRWHATPHAGSPSFSWHRYKERNAGDDSGGLSNTLVSTRTARCVNYSWWCSSFVGTNTASRNKWRIVVVDER
jgi:hypothetical protein